MNFRARTVVRQDWEFLVRTRRYAAGSTRAPNGLNQPRNHGVAAPGLLRFPRPAKRGEGEGEGRWHYHERPSPSPDALRASTSPRFAGRGEFSVLRKSAILPNTQTVRRSRLSHRFSLWCFSPMPVFQSSMTFGGSMRSVVLAFALLAAATSCAGGSSSNDGSGGAGNGGAPGSGGAGNGGVPGSGGKPGTGGARALAASLAPAAPWFGRQARYWRQHAINRRRRLHRRVVQLQIGQRAVRRHLHLAQQQRQQELLHASQLVGHPGQLQRDRRHQRVGFTLNTPSMVSSNDSPLGFPSIFIGSYAGHNTTGSNLPKQVLALTSVPTIFDVTEQGTSNYNATYDVWFTPADRRSQAARVALAAAAPSSWCGSSSPALTRTLAPKPGSLAAAS